MAIGSVSSLVAWALLALINLITSLAYYGALQVGPSSPVDNHLGPWATLVPVVGGLVIGLMARYGSEKIRGHGIPEALE